MIVANDDIGRKRGYGLKVQEIKSLVSETFKNFGVLPQHVVVNPNHILVSFENYELLLNNEISLLVKILSSALGHSILFERVVAQGNINKPYLIIGFKRA